MEENKMEERFFPVREEPRLLPEYAESLPFGQIRRMKQATLPGFNESPVVYVKGNGKSNGNGHYTAMPGQLSLWSEPENKTLLGVGQTGPIVPLYPETERTLLGVGAPNVEEFDDEETPVIDMNELPSLASRGNRPMLEGVGLVKEAVPVVEPQFDGSASPELTNAFLAALDSEHEKKANQIIPLSEMMDQVSEAHEEFDPNEPSLCTRSMDIFVRNGRAGMEDTPQDSRIEGAPRHVCNLFETTSESVTRSLDTLKKMNEKRSNGFTEESIMRSLDKTGSQSVKLAQEKIDQLIEQSLNDAAPRTTITSNQHLSVSTASGNIGGKEEDITLEIRAEQEFKKETKSGFFGGWGRKVAQVALAAGMATMAYVGVASFNNNTIGKHNQPVVAMKEKKALVAVKPSLAVFNPQEKAEAYTAHLTQPTIDSFPPVQLSLTVSRKDQIYTSLVEDLSKGIGRSNETRYNLKDGLTNQNVINIVLKRWFKNKG
ncbi:MAG: hypothetical protein ABIA37_05115, partial [Candidatus Woesearchaeota archaeon]